MGKFDASGKVLDTKIIRKCVDRVGCPTTHKSSRSFVNRLTSISTNPLTAAQGKYADAEPLYQRLLAIAEKALGPEHPDFATHVSDLAEVLKSQVKASFLSGTVVGKFRAPVRGRAGRFRYLPELVPLKQCLRIVRRLQ